MITVSIIDYGMGNLHSVTKALDAAGAKPIVISSVREIADSTALVLPGVGHFGEAMNRLSEEGFGEVIQKHIEWKRPFLGICLGMQTLFESSEEAPGVPGLGIFRGTVRRFPTTMGLPVPAIGWNLVGDERYYFVHSYYVAPEDKKIIAAECEYGIRYPASVRSENVFATQFHPEKSGDAGIALLKRWVSEL